MRLIFDAPVSYGWDIRGGACMLGNVIVIDA